MKHPIGFKPSWPRLLYKPGEPEREEGQHPSVDLIADWSHDPELVTDEPALDQPED